MTMIEGAIVYEELGRAVAPVAPLRQLRALGRRDPARGGTDEQKSEWLPKIASGEAILTPAWIEPGGGFAPVSVQARAESDGDGFTITGVEGARVLRLGRRPAAGPGPHRRRRRPTSTCSSSTRQRDGVTLDQKMSISSDTQYHVEFDASACRRRTASAPRAPGGPPGSP